MDDMVKRNRVTRKITHACISPTQAMEIYSSDEPSTTIAEQFGVSYYTAWDIRAGRSWSIVTQLMRPGRYSRPPSDGVATELVREAE